MWRTRESNFSKKVLHLHISYKMNPKLTLAGSPKKDDKYPITMLPKASHLARPSYLFYVIDAMKTAPRAPIHSYHTPH